MDSWRARITEKDAYLQISEGQILLDMTKALNDRHNDVIAIYDKTLQKTPKLCAVIRTNDLVAVGYPRDIVNRMLENTGVQASLPDVFRKISKSVPPTLSRLTVANLDTTNQMEDTMDDNIIIEEDEERRSEESEQLPGSLVYDRVTDSEVE